jgi:DNA-nicking Smr family endonuclease
MARRKTKKKRNAKPAVKKEKPGLLAHQPFEGLKGLKINTVPADGLEKPVASAEKPVVSAKDDSALFLSSMAGVTPMNQKNSRVAPQLPDTTPQGPDPVQLENLEVLAKLEDLVDGRAQFDIVDTDEYIEGYIKGIHPIILEKLRQGFFSVQSYLDLHGLTVREAEVAVREFIDEAIRLNYRCVLLVHGRGMNSKNQVPVLKRRLKTILLRGPVRKKILAFTSARPHDGGAGASYVLLRVLR